MESVHAAGLPFEAVAVVAALVVVAVVVLVTVLGLVPVPATVAVVGEAYAAWLQLVNETGGARVHVDAAGCVRRVTLVHSDPLPYAGALLRDRTVAWQGTLALEHIEAWTQIEPSEHTVEPYAVVHGLDFERGPVLELAHAVEREYEQVVAHVARDVDELLPTQLHCVNGYEPELARAEQPVVVAVEVGADVDAAGDGVEQPLLARRGATNAVLDVVNVAVADGEVAQRHAVSR